MSEHVERWRIQAAEWLDLQKAADLLRETKNDVFAQIKSEQEGGSEAAKDRLARISSRWSDFRDSMISAEDKARRAKMNMKYQEMKFDEWRSQSANARQEKGRY